MDRADRSSDKARSDARLAWIIVGVSALVTLTLAILLGGWAFRQAKVAAEANWQLDKVGKESPPTDVVMLPVPPNTAKPIGNAATWVGPDDYPVAAIIAREEGRVRVTLAIDATGKPTGCAVAQRSGSWSLDNGTCLVMMRKGRFDRAEPGQIGARPGEVRRWTSPPVRWVMPN